MVAEVDIKSVPLAASTTGEPFLRIRLKGKVVARVLLNKSRLTLGRSPRADIVLDQAAGVSREHAHILIVDGEVLIEDLSSRNGTFVNGRICQRRTLEHGDRIAIGSYRLRFRDPSRPIVAEPSAQEKTAALLRMWNDAAIVQRPDECPLCCAEMDAGPDGRTAVDADGAIAADRARPNAGVDAALEQPASSHLASSAAAPGDDASAVAESDAAVPTPTERGEDEAADPDGLARTDALPQIVAADSCPTMPSAILLMPDGMRRPAPAVHLDEAIPSGLASAGETMEGMFPELFLVPHGGTGYSRRPEPVAPAGSVDGTSAAARGLVDPAVDVESGSDVRAHEPGSRKRRFRRTLIARKRLRTRK